MTTVKVLSFLTLFVIGTDTFLVAPLLPLLRGVLKVGVAESGWLVSAYALGYAVTALSCGPLSDRSDRRDVLLAGLAGFIVCPGGCAMAWSFWSLFAARLLAGPALVRRLGQAIASARHDGARPVLSRHGTRDRNGVRNGDSDRGDAGRRVRLPGLHDPAAGAFNSARFRSAVVTGPAHANVML